VTAELGSGLGVKWWSWMLDDDESSPGNFLRWRLLIGVLTLAWVLVLVGGAAIYRVFA
jgi:hypothetical protein